MFRLKHISGLLFFVFLFSCVEDYEVETPSFEVATDKLEYNAGDSVIFHLEGEPDIITFYSGETGQEYRYRYRTERESGKTEVEFVSRVLYGTQTNNMLVMASSDFSGDYNASHVTAANWQDISSRFTLPSANAPGYAYSLDTPSGKVDISDLLVSGKPLYFAFKYAGRKAPDEDPTAKTQRTWRITTFNMTATFDDNEVSTLANLSTAGWLAVDVIPSVGAWTIASPVQYNPNGCLTDAESWVISKPLYPNKATPDNGKAIKNYSQRRDSFGYRYNKPGEYTVTFEASNATYKGQKTVVREIVLKIN